MSNKKGSIKHGQISGIYRVYQEKCGISGRVLEMSAMHFRYQQEWDFLWWRIQVWFYGKTIATEGCACDRREKNKTLRAIGGQNGRDS